METAKFKLNKAHTINGVAYNEGDVVEIDARTAQAYEGAGIGEIIKEDAKKKAPAAAPATTEPK